MSANEYERGEERFEILRTCLNRPCKNLLRNILQLKYKTFEDLQSNISLDKLSDVSKEALKMLNDIRQLKFTVLCDILKSGVCDSFLVPPAIGWNATDKIPESSTEMADDILRIWKIWNDNIENSPSETISDNESNIILSDLMEVAKRISTRQGFEDIGREFLKEISSAREDIFDAMQIGNRNSIQIICGSSFNGSVNLVQVGSKNKVILYDLKDERSVFEDSSSRYTKAVLRSDNSALQDLAESASNLNIEEINEDPVIKGNNITIIEIKRGSLVVMFIIKNNYTLEKNIEWTFQCIFGRHEIAQVLENQGVHEVRVHGYIYNPQEYCLEFSRQSRMSQTEEADNLYRAAKFHSHSHLTWAFGECTCDVDVLLTDLFHNLSTHGFTTEVNDNVWVMAKGHIIHPEEIAFSSIARMITENVDDKEKDINFQLTKSGHYEIQGIKSAGDSIQFILKTKTCVEYTDLVAEDGVILTVVKRLLFANLIPEVKLMRIGIVVDTELMQGQGNQKQSSLEVKFRSESKFTDAEEKRALPQIFTRVIEKLAKSDDEIPSRLKLKVELNDGTCDSKMRVAIDIGNIFSGYAFATYDELKQEPVKIQVSTWDDPSSERISYKTPSNILLDEDKNLVAFGFDAERRYCDLAENGQHLNFYYFCRIKMLFNDIAKEKHLTSSPDIADVTGKKLPADLVISHAIRYLKDHFFNTLENRGTFCKKDEIEWIITIPLMWSDAAKRFLENAAVEAGIPMNELTLVSEPEAATLWYKHFNKQRRRKNEDACKYIVLDAGGSVDITLCQHTSNGKFAMIDKMDSLQSGGIGVDQAFKKILTEIVGEDFLEQYRQNHQKDYANIFKNFEVEKRLYSREFPPNQKITLKIPVSFGEECKFRLSTDLNLLTSNTRHRNKVFWERGKLCIDCLTFKRLFEPICDEIMQHIQEMIHKTDEEKIGEILMVGGFSNNFILQDTMKNDFPELTVIIPQNAELAMMEGSLLFLHKCFEKYELKDDPDQVKKKETKEKELFNRQKENDPEPPVDIFHIDIIKDTTQFVASIEIGNSFSGYAFISRKDLDCDPLQSTTSFWCSGRSLKTSKVPSTLLLDKEKKFVAFGYEAEAKYMELREEEEHFEFYYFPRLLMMFYSINTNHEVIKDVTGKQMPTVDVLTQAIKYLCDHCLDTMNIQVSLDEIAWVFIVPPVLNEDAIHFIQMAAEKAGICQNNAKIVWTPDAASVYLNVLRKDKLRDEEEKEPLFYSGSKYLLLDAGGMTLGLFAYEVLPNGKLMELDKSGGGINVDQTFEAFFRELFGDLVFEKFCAEYPADYLDLLHEFEAKKRTFGSRINNLPVESISLYLPISLREVCRKDFKTIIDKTRYKDHIKLKVSKLVIDHATFNSFFEHACHETIRHVHTLLASSKLKGISTIFMVGGFSESAILQNAMKDAFPSYRIVVAEDPSLAALKGAVLMAGETSIDDRRISKYTFGVDTFQIFNPSIHNPMKKKTICGVDYCVDIFSIHVRCGDLLSPKRDFSQVAYMPIYPNQKEICFKIYITKKRDILYIDEPNCIQLGTIIVPIPSSRDRCVKCFMRFERTEMTLIAVFPETGRSATVSCDISTRLLR